MTDINNNDAIHGDEHLMDVSDHSMRVAKRQYLEMLASGDSSARDTAIDTLINSDMFWKAVFNIGAADSCGQMNHDALARGAAEINAAVELATLKDVGELAEVIEGMRE